MTSLDLDSRRLRPARKVVGKGAAATPPGRVRAPSAGAARGWLRWWAPVAVLLVPLGLLAAGILASSSSHFSFMADQALIDRSVRAARHGAVALGPYDRFGWHHPGPSYFYLLAGLSFLLGPGAVADYTGTLVINVAAAVAVVALVRRRVGRSASWWAAALVAGLAAGAGPELLSQPWGPDIVMLPMLAMAVLAADAMAGCALSLLGAVLVGSLVVQTEMAAAPLAGLFLLAGGLGSTLRWWRGRSAARSSGGAAGAAEAPPRAAGLAAAAPLGAAGLAAAPPGAAGLAAAPRVGRRRHLVALAGVVLLAVMWAPTVAEQLAVPLEGVPARAPVSVLHPGHPQVSMRDGNLVAIWRYLSAGYAHHSASTGASALDANAFFSHYLLASEPLVALLAGLALGAVTLWLAHRRPSGMAGPLALLGLSAIPVGVYSASRIVGTIHVWDLNWAPVIPSTMALGLLCALCAPGARRQRLHVRVGMAVPAWAVAAVASLALSGSVLAGPSLAAQSSGQVSAAWAEVSALMPAAGHVVELDPGNRRDYGLAAGLADHMAAQGLKVAVPPGWQVEFGPAPTARPSAEVRVTRPGFSQPLPGMRFLGSFGGYGVYFERFGVSPHGLGGR